MLCAVAAHIVVYEVRTSIRKRDGKGMSFTGCNSWNIYFYLYFVVFSWAGGDDSGSWICQRCPRFIWCVKLCSSAYVCAFQKLYKCWFFDDISVGDGIGLSYWPLEGTRRPFYSFQSLYYVAKITNKTRYILLYAQLFYCIHFLVHSSI